MVTDIWMQVFDVPLPDGTILGSREEY